MSDLLRTYKPRTPGIRHLRRPINDHLWKGRPIKSLTHAKKGHARGGRNNTGRITVRHRGGGHKRRIRTVDFYRKGSGAQKVERIEYDPGRSAHIALLVNQAGHQSYIVAAEGMREGDTVQSYMAGIPKDLLASMGGTIDPGMLAAKTAFRGNCLPVHLIPIGTQIYNIGFMPKGKAIYCRSAGTYGVIVSREQDDGKGYVVIRLQSGEVRKVHAGAPATIGVASNSAWHFRQLGKAGRARWLGIRPTVRGVAMNAGKCRSLSVFHITWLHMADPPAQSIILMVVAEESRRETNNQHLRGARPQRVATRHERSETSIITL